MSTVSVVIINFNGMADLAGCLDSVLAQDYPEMELVAIDNASDDGSAEWLARWVEGDGNAKRFVKPPVLIRNEVNVGFSPALNRGIEASSGPLVMPLNTDVVLDPGFMSAMVGALEGSEVGSASGKLLRFPVGGADNHIDSAGHVMFKNRLAYNVGEGQPAATGWNEPREIWGTCGAAALYKREMLRDVAVDGECFDEDFFAFWEDLDLDWRARMRGWRCAYEPAALAWHRRGGAGYRKSLLVERHNYKNRFLMMIKNDSGRYVLRNLPGIVFTEAMKAGALLVRCPRALLGLVDVIRLTPGMIRKRRVIQSRRVVPARELEHWFEPFGYRWWIRKHLLERKETIVREESEKVSSREHA